MFKDSVKIQQRVLNGMRGPFLLCLEATTVDVGLTKGFDIKPTKFSSTHDNLVNRDVNELHKVANETHHKKANCGGDRDFAEFLGVRFCAPLY